MNSILNQLRDEDAKSVFEAVKGLFSEEDLVAFQFAIAAYCNEQSAYLRLAKTADLTDYKVSCLVAGHFKRALELAKQLQLTPKTRGKTEEALDIEMP